ncbi:MAG: PP2C family protein-serine/threonine phosphatase [Chitinophagales bacterium]|nr:PP2C family protein-serine/threonine phosphatase [Chitinophagales bacterium]MDW8417844.1 PP2C family protein-serine/threonine phosphatase [Chitinophagales bacterium]
MSGQHPFSELDFFKKRLSFTERLLAIKQQQIDSLLEITRAVNNNMPITALARIYENILHAQLGVKKVALFIKDKDDLWACITPGELPASVVNYDVNAKLVNLSYITPVASLQDSTLADFELIIPVLHKKEPVGYALIGSFGAESSDTKEEKLKFIQTITNVIVVANENKKLFKNQLEQLMMQKELKLAADMQNLLVPTNLPNNEAIEVGAFYKPHKNIGGDYYDFIQISPDEIAFCISDISGKGIPAAILMANFQANMRILLTRRYSLQNFIEVLNAKVCEITKGEKFITLFVGIYHFKTRQLQYINAGHNPSLLFSNGEAQLLDKGCTILGMFDNLPYINIGEIDLHPGDLLVNYTDGLSEAMNNEGKLFDIKGIIDFIQQHATLPITELHTKLINHVITYKQDMDFDDDITLLSMRFK